MMLFKKSRTDSVYGTDPVYATSKGINGGAEAPGTFTQGPVVVPEVEEIAELKAALDAANLLIKEGSNRKKDLIYAK